MAVGHCDRRCRGDAIPLRGALLRRPGVAAIEGGQDAPAAIPLVAGQTQDLQEAPAVPSDIGLGETGHRALRDLGRELRLRSIGQPQRQRAGILARVALREAAALAPGQCLGCNRERGIRSMSSPWLRHSSPVGEVNGCQCHGDVGDHRTPDA